MVLARNTEKAATRLVADLASDQVLLEKEAAQQKLGLQDAVVEVPDITEVVLVQQLLIIQAAAALLSFQGIKDALQ